MAALKDWLDVVAHLEFGIVVVVVVVVVLFEGKGSVYKSLCS